MKIRLVIYHILSLLIVLGILLFGVFYLRPVFYRTGQVFIEFGTSVGFYFQELFLMDWGISVDVSITNNYFEGFSLNLLPDVPELFFKQLGLVFLNLFNADFFEYRLFRLGIDARYLMVVVTILMILGLIFYIVFRNYVYDDSNKAGYVTTQLLIYDKIVDKINFVIDEIKAFFYFFFVSFYKIIFVLEILYFTNVINVFIYFLSFYFYFCGSFDFAAIYFLIKKILIDFSFLLRPQFTLFWVIVLYLFFKFMFRKIAMRRIYKYHSKDICFVNDLGLLTLIVGTMAKGKTTCMTDMGLNAESIFRDTALEMMFNISLEFPSIDFRLFEINLDEAFKNNEIYNLHTCKQWIYENVHKDYLDHSYFDGIKEVSLYEVFFNYVQLYWLYSSPTSYIISNYSVRSGLMVYSNKHLIEFCDDFFSPSLETYEDSLFSHILDYNNFRPLKKINNRLEWSSSVDVGVFLNDEIGKERLNKNELEDVKKGDISANQKNDGLNVALKLARHQSTINHYPFFKWIGAEQRSQSVPADYRELNDIILNMSSEMDDKNCYPFFFFFSWCLDVIDSAFRKFFISFRHNRDDNTLLFQIFKNVLSWVVRTRKHFDHNYGLKIVYFDVLNGSEQVIGQKKYYLIKQKIYSSRFATDAYSGINEKRYSESTVGLNHIPTYVSEKATEDEFRLQNSYLMNGLFSVPGVLKKTGETKKKSSYKWVKIDNKED